MELRSSRETVPGRPKTRSALSPVKGLPEEKIEITTKPIDPKSENVEILKMDFDNVNERINLVNESMCYVPVQINDNPNEVMALVDSGSNATIVDNQLIESSGYTESEDNPWRFGKVKLALGNEGMPIGTIMLKIKVFDREFMVESIVTNDRKNKMILGIGIIRALGLIMNFRDKTFRLASDESQRNFDWTSKERLMMTTNHLNLTNGSSSNDQPNSKIELIQPPTKDEIWNVQKPENIKTIDDLVSHFPELFSDKLGTCKYLKVPIDIEESKPIKCPMRFYPKWKQVVIDEIISKLLEKGIVKESFSPWRAWPLILVKGDGGGYRCCIDYRELNKITKEFAFPKPQIRDIETRLGGGKTKKMMIVDVSQAYYQCMLEPSDTEKTAFSTHNGHYEFIRMAFGLKNAVAYFIYIKNKILGSLIGTVCEVFIDDILILGRDDNELLKNAFLVFSALERAGLTLNKAKIKFDLPEIKYVGMILTADGIKPNPDKVKSILELEPPQSISDIRQLMGMVNWFNKFIPDLASIAKPIYDLTSPKNEYKWDENCELAFNEIKFQLSNMVMKAYPDFDKEFIIECDASAIGYGAKLYQMTDDNKEKIIEFTSKSLNRSESE